MSHSPPVPPSKPRLLVPQSQIHVEYKQLRPDRLVAFNVGNAGTGQLVLSEIGHREDRLPHTYSLRPGEWKSVDVRLPTGNAGGPGPLRAWREFYTNDPTQTLLRLVVTTWTPESKCESPPLGPAAIPGPDAVVLPSTDPK